MVLYLKKEINKDNYMSDQKTIDAKSLSRQLEKLIDITGDSCGPLLIKELQERMDKTSDSFNQDVNKLIQNSFNNHNSRMNFCRKIINDKKLIEENENVDDEEGIIPPQFIQLYEEKFGKKL